MADRRRGRTDCGRLDPGRLPSTSAADGRAMGLLLCPVAGSGQGGRQWARCAPTASMIPRAACSRRPGHIPETMRLAGGSVPGERAGSRASAGRAPLIAAVTARSEEHTSELQSLMRISYAVFCLKKKKKITTTHPQHYL